MGDVAQILGIKNNKKDDGTNISIISKTDKKAFSAPPPGPPSSHTIPRSIQNSSTVLNKPVLKILAGKSESQNYTPSSSLPPIVPSHNLPLQTVKKKDTTTTLHQTPLSSAINNQPTFHH